MSSNIEGVRVFSYARKSYVGAREHMNMLSMQFSSTAAVAQGSGASLSARVQLARISAGRNSKLCIATNISS